MPNGHDIVIFFKSLVSGIYLRAVQEIHRIRHVPKSCNKFISESKSNYRDCVFVQDRQVIADTSIHISDSMELGGDEAGEERYECGGEEGLNEKRKLIVTVLEGSTTNRALNYLGTLCSLTIQGSTHTIWKFKPK